jgi:transcriptional regulator with GAF, ATPase, and Fis domain
VLVRFSNPLQEKDLDSIRRKHIRSLVHGLNLARRRQAKQIDILCTDMVAAHGEFSVQLRSLVDTIHFYEAILGKKDLTSLLDTSASQVQSLLADTKVAIFLLESNGFAMHRVPAPSDSALSACQLESGLSAEIVHNLSNHRKLCMLDGMWEMGLEDVSGEFRKLTAVAIPLSHWGPGLGFILLYRAASKPFNKKELEKIQSLVPGLRDAIRALRSVPATA